MEKVIVLSLKSIDENEMPFFHLFFHFRGFETYGVRINSILP